MLLDLRQEMTQLGSKPLSEGDPTFLDLLYQLDTKLQHARSEAKSSGASSARIVLTDSISITLPLFGLGLVHSADLLGLDDVIAFSIYLRQYTPGRKFLDVGANIGLHTVIASKIGYSALAFEPDKRTCEKLVENLRENGVSFEVGDSDEITLENNEAGNKVTVYECAVSDFNGSSEFVQIGENFFGNHLSGAKSEPYGELSSVETPVVCAEVFSGSRGVVKVDAEGADAKILRAMLFADNPIDGMTVLLCDWRNETRAELYDLISDSGVEARLGRSSSLITRIEQVPHTRDSDFVVLGTGGL